MRNIEDESEEELDQLYHLLLAEMGQDAKRDRKSKSIDTFAKKETKINKENKFYEQKKNKKAIYEPYVDIDDILESRAEGEKKYFKGIVDFNERIKYYAKIFTK